MRDDLCRVDIFLASSLTELQEDRRELGGFIGRLNDALLDRGAYLKLFACENESAAMVGGRMQEQYNEWLRGARLGLFLFRSRAGAYTLEEFDVALERFRAAGSPEIAVCFRRCAGEALEQSLLDFQRRLDGMPEIPRRSYAHVDELKLYFLSLLRRALPNVAIELRGDVAQVNGRAVLSLRSIPASSLEEFRRSMR